MTAVTVIVEEPLWRDEGRGFPGEIRAAVRLALAGAPKRRSGSVTILLSGDQKLAELNGRFRGKPKPTNVLSFTSVDADYLGDIAIAYGVTVREARETGKSIHDHALHLAVHGALHLLGYDHEIAREARIMESLEIAILSKLGISDPYGSRRKTAN